MNLGTIKKASLSIGIYRYARILHRHLNRSEMNAHISDKRLYSKLLPQSSVLCFDVGANIGRMTEVLLELGHDVIAFEPQKECVREIKARCSPFESHLKIEEVALGDSAGAAPLFVRALSGQTSLRSEWEGKVTGKTEVLVSTLDLAIKQYGVPHYCKIDVEGWESQVLHGLSRPIPLISFEYHQDDGKMRDAYACLDRLRSIANIEVNITPREQSTLALDHWVDADEFKSAFRSKFCDKDDFLYGDLYVKML
jgi:FkbM family methyltransferase